MPRDADAATGTKEVGGTDVVCGFYRSTSFEKRPTEATKFEMIKAFVPLRLST